MNPEDLSGADPNTLPYFITETPFGLTKAEIRIMYIWQDKLRAVCPLIRMGRGSMMGVDQNRNLECVGASAGFHP